MPSLITHDIFGRNVYDCLYTFIGGSRDESDAFLLGNQGPDPLFYVVIDPRLREYITLGNMMHDTKPAELIAGFKSSLSILEASERGVGRAYALGFLCHYLLDSTVHPLVYFNQFNLCNAGEPGLDENHSAEVHGVIESELDELILFHKREQTISSFKPASEILQGSPFVLEVVSKMYAYVMLTVYGKVIPGNLFSQATKYFRLAQKAFHSPRGIKRKIVGQIERLVRDHSFFQSMSHRPHETLVSSFDNREHAPWENPFTGEVCTDSFWDLYETALSKAKSQVVTFDQPSFDIEAARELVRGLDFSGKPVQAIVLNVENGDQTTAKPEGKHAADTLSSATPSSFGSHN